MSSTGLYAMHHDQFNILHGDRPNIPNIAFVVTDGHSVNSELTIQQAEDARASGINIVSIGITYDVHEDEVKAIASLPQTKNRNFFLCRDFMALEGIKTQVLDEIC